MGKAMVFLIDENEVSYVLALLALKSAITIPQQCKVK